MSEFTVIEGSPFIGLKLKDLVNKYKVEIPHFHNPTLDSDTRTPYKPDAVIKNYFSIKVSGLAENIGRLRLDSVNYS